MSYYLTGITSVRLRIHFQSGQDRELPSDTPLSAISDETRSATMNVLQSLFATVLSDCSKQRQFPVESKFPKTFFDAKMALLNPVPSAQF